MPKRAAALWRAVFFFILWLILTGGNEETLIIGALLSALLAIAFFKTPASSLRLGALFYFVFWFFAQSFLSGLDVARRALLPALPLDPGTVLYECDPLSPVATRLFAALVSLMPGTLSMHLEGTRLQIHLLDRQSNALEDLDRLKEKVAGLFK